MKTIKYRQDNTTKTVLSKSISEGKREKEGEVARKRGDKSRSHRDIGDLSVHWGGHASHSGRNGWILVCLGRETDTRFPKNVTEETIN